MDLIKDELGISRTEEKDVIWGASKDYKLESLESLNFKDALQENFSTEEFWQLKRITSKSEYETLSESYELRGKDLLIETLVKSLGK